MDGGGASSEGLQFARVWLPRHRSGQAGPQVELGLVCALIETHVEPALVVGLVQGSRELKRRYWKKERSCLSVAANCNILNSEFIC